jgi:SAM-dependent methyltransferase
MFRKALKLGMALTLRRVAAEVVDPYWEWHFGVSSSGTVTAEELGFPRPGYASYQPAFYIDLARLMRSLPINYPSEVFLDVGSGMGRALVLAAMHPFQGVLGIEISPWLNAIAERNLERVRHKLRCRHVQVLEGDILHAEIPSSVTVVYVFNSLSCELFGRGVLENLTRSLRKNPRRILLVHHRTLDDPMYRQQLLDCPWLSPHSCVRLPSGRIADVYQSTSGSSLTQDAHAVVAGTAEARCTCDR